MPLRMGILVLSLLTLVSCGSTNLYVIDKQDIFQVTKGTQIGEIKTDRDGYFLSNLYMDKVVEAKIKRQPK